MMNEPHISPDDLFRENLQGMEVPYEQAGWEKMTALLDESSKKRPFFWWFQKNKKTTLTLLISLTMITSAIILVMNIISTGNEKNTTQIAAPVSIENNRIYNPENTDSRPDKNSGESPLLRNQNSTAFYAENTAGNENANAAQTSVKKDETEENNTAAENSDGTANVEKTAENTGAENNVSTATSDSVKTEEPIAALIKKAAEDAAKNAANPVKKVTPYTPVKGLTTLKDYQKNDGPFRGPWIGLHFAMQYPETPELKDTWRQNAGFNFQFMSSNLTGRRDFGGYLGFDFGMQFTGRGNKSNVVLDNSSLDSGFTRLSNYSMDFFARGHFEYAKFRLKPYINAFAGPRLFVTSQYTEAYRHKTDYDNSSSTNANTSASFMYGAGVGARYRLSKVVSIDFRYDVMQGTETSLVNVDKSQFNGLTYNLSKFKVAPAYTQFKFGFLFDLGEEDEVQHVNQTTETTEYYRYDSTTQQFIKVNCSCKQWPVNDTSSNQDSIIIIKKKTYNPYYPAPSGSGGGSGKSSGGGYWPSGSSGNKSKGFPGIKSGGGTIKPKS